MHILLKFLKWQFTPSGIIAAEEEKPPQKSYWRAFRRLFSGGVQYGAPTTGMFMTYVKWGRPLKRYQCKFCKVFFWSWRKQNVCWKWACVRRA